MHVIVVSWVLDCDNPCKCITLQVNMTHSYIWYPRTISPAAEALHFAHLMASHGYFFPIDDHILTVKNDNTYYRFQVGDGRLADLDRAVATYAFLIWRGRGGELGGVRGVRYGDVILRSATPHLRSRMGGGENGTCCSGKTAPRECDVRWRVERRRSARRASTPLRFDGSQAAFFIDFISD